MKCLIILAFATFASAIQFEPFALTWRQAITRDLENPGRLLRTDTLSIDDKTLIIKECLQKIQLLLQDVQNLRRAELSVDSLNVRAEEIADRILNELVKSKEAIIVQIIKEVKERLEQGRIVNELKRRGVIKALRQLESGLYNARQTVTSPDEDFLQLRDTLRAIIKAEVCCRIIGTDPACCDLGLKIEKLVVKHITTRIFKCIQKMQLIVQQLAEQQGFVYQERELLGVRVSVVLKEKLPVELIQLLEETKKELDVQERCLIDEQVGISIVVQELEKFVIELEECLQQEVIRDEVKVVRRF